MQLTFALCSPGRSSVVVFSQRNVSSLYKLIEPIIVHPQRMHLTLQVIQITGYKNSSPVKYFIVRQTDTRLMASFPRQPG